MHVGEPDCPVAATERGRRVPVRANEYLTVADYDLWINPIMHFDT